MPSWAPWDNWPPPPYGRDRLAPDSLWLSTPRRSPLHRSLVLQSGEHSEQFTPIDHDLRALGLRRADVGRDGAGPGPAPGCSGRPWRRARPARGRGRRDPRPGSSSRRRPRRRAPRRPPRADRAAGRMSAGGSRSPAPASVTSSAASSDGRSRSASARAVARARSASTMTRTAPASTSARTSGADRDEAHARPPGELTDRGRAVDLLEHPEAEVAERDRLGRDLTRAYRAPTRSSRSRS